MIVVYAYVVGDIIHKGHLLALKNAKNIGDKLIVGVLTDKAVMEKKPRPTIKFEERLRIIESFKFVDCVVSQEDYSPIENIKMIKPDILMESSSHLDKDLKKIFKVTNDLNIRVIKMPYYPLQSSTKIKNFIKKEKTP